MSSTSQIPHSGSSPVPVPAVQSGGGTPALAHNVIEPRPGWRPIDLRELLHFRDLFWFLAIRDVKVRYKQTVLGVAWAVIQPLFTMIVFYVFFGRLGQLGPERVPYIPWSLAGLVPWTLFANALTNASNSLVAEQKLISKVYFPRLIVPSAAVLGGLVDVAIALVLLLIAMPFFHVRPGWQILTMPAFVALALVTALAVSLWLSALNVKYRDVRYTLPFLTQLWLFLTPVAYPSSRVPEHWRALYGMNPMSGVVEGFRWALIRDADPPGAMLWVSAAISLLLFAGGLFYFRRMERGFADLV